ncbi:beta-galactosidase [Novosphingobium sp. PASSN1]|uniref:beta-galactosidase n=1 Tax=Novosphingobium sp. PASSN1 TaxID=2015561 RepID=UPI000BCB6AB7|nr:beta-galactosidase [Novosphingobium sp. PASSN1]OYU35523.1 MAG: beta-galactosidase [Novosphingobium sp. PASSN1]
MKLGVCYYPEHWLEDLWAEDARRMAEIGISHVRIGEFAWSRIEPEPGHYAWEWLDRAVETLAAAGLKIVMGTPTATPPKWLVDRMPDMIALDQQGRARRFGSRRHYCFSHEGYARECERIVAVMAARYGQHPAVAAWQTDNEYGCHDTAWSWSEAACDGFRRWLAAKYGDVAALNAAWGNVFWSMEYRSFDEIDLPNLTVTVPNPAHDLDFRRFSSDQVAAFNRRQVAILRRLSPGRDVVHNFMGFFTQFDHHAVGADLDVASWDSYPLGFLEQFWFSPEEKQAYARQGHPDIAAFHHDLYRGCQRDGRWWVMEQQPGPVNWARYNPAPLPGMVRLWTLEAMAHGAELVSYFRWRQAPFAQEQMHAGLLRPDSTEAEGAGEARAAARDIAALAPVGKVRSPVALVFDYASDWVTGIMPQGQGFSALRIAFEYYSALRQLGLDIDIVSSAADLGGYALVVIPCQPIMDEAFVQRLAASGAVVVIGAGSGGKTADFSIPAQLAPGPLQQILPLRVTRVETLRGAPCEWIETVETALPEAAPGHFIHGRLHYLARYPAEATRAAMLRQAAEAAGLAVMPLPEGLRVRRAGSLVFVFNYAAHPQGLPEGLIGAPLIGEATLPPAGVVVGVQVVSEM